MYLKMLLKQKDSLLFDSPLLQWKDNEKGRVNQSRMCKESR